MKQAETLVAQVPQAELMDEQQLNREVTDIEFQAEAMVIQNDEDYAAAGEFGKLLKQRGARLVLVGDILADEKLHALIVPFAELLLKLLHRQVFAAQAQDQHAAHDVEDGGADAAGGGQG